MSLAGTARGQAITEYSIPTATSGPLGIAAGPDGNLWFTEYGANKIGRITTAGVITEFSIPTASSSPSGIAAGPDGNLWFTEYGGNKIGRITTAGVIVEFSTPTASSLPYGIAAGPDGNLWFTEVNGNKIGRITTAGYITNEFSIPTANSQSQGIAAGSDGNLWFTEVNGNKIGRITTAGVITEFSTPTASSGPFGIAAGPDGNLWFTEYGGNKIGRITTAGDITNEFFIPTASSLPYGIAAGPGGNLWFTEYGANQIGRITTAGAIAEFSIPTASSYPYGIAAGPDGNLWFPEYLGNQIGRFEVIPQPERLDVDTAGNQVWEPGETVGIDPYYYNNAGGALVLTGTATSLTGPPGATYTIPDPAADYGTIDPGFLGGCSFTPDCYSVSVDNPATRPAAHWDAALQETLSNGAAKTWVLHIGGSFADAPPSNPFYPFIENIFHHGITSGCGGGSYCPDNSVTRGQMAVFLLKAKHGPAFVPPACTGVFPDVPCPSQFANWIEELFHEGITGGCGGGNYCPNNPVRRDQMAAFLLKAEHGSSYVPPACTGVFPDVACPSTFADWIEQLFHENVTGGCGGGNYCPLNPNTRGQMAVFLAKTFFLKLYGP